MSNQNSKTNRRKLLKTLAAGGGVVATGKSLPESWSKPVINAIVLPAHAALTDDTGTSPGDQTTTTLAPVCCAGVFCGLQFDAPIGGGAQVNSDCTIIMEGGSIVGDWSGSGTMASDGTFSFDVIFTNPVGGPPVTTTPGPSVSLRVSGAVAVDCSTLEGVMEEFGSFSGAVTPGASSLNDCRG